MADTSVDSGRSAPPRLPGDDLHVPFDVAIRCARQRKAVLPAEFYGARLQTMRARSFTVSGLAALDQVQQVADSAEAAASGQTLREWRKTLAPRAPGQSVAMVHVVLNRMRRAEGGSGCR
jgi:hypothetical protein